VITLGVLILGMQMFISENSVHGAFFPNSSTLSYSPLYGKENVEAGFTGGDSNAHASTPTTSSSSTQDNDDDNDNDNDDSEELLIMPSRWPPFDENPDDPNLLQCNKKAKFHANNSQYQRGGDNVVKFRHGHIANWYKDGCKQWHLDGEWKERDRKIYYGFAFGGELEVLTVVLEEIYPSVDYIIILEGKQTWRGEQKPLFFPPVNQTHFAKYMDKIRYIPYGFDDEVVGARIKDCMRTDPSGVYGPGPMACRWLRQWGARDYIAMVGAKDIRDNDVFVITDLDELLAREFLRALKHCDVWPEPKHPDKCSRMGCQVFGHRYHFGCTIAKNFGHFHPDLVLGRCLSKYGGEEVRRDWGKRKRYNPRPPGLLKAKYVGPTGWHMHSFLSASQIAWKWFSRSGAAKASWSVNDLAQIESQRRDCNDDKNFFTIDARACEPIPHIIRENPQKWAHFLRYVNDGELRDEFNVERNYRQKLMPYRDPGDTAPLPWEKQ